MDRKLFYLGIVENYAQPLSSLQYMGKDDNRRGCFFYPYWRGETDFVNSRWQEAVLTLAWLCKKNKSLKERVVSGIDFWCKIQNKDGSFPEVGRGDKSFSATAFTSLAVSEAIERVGSRDVWFDSLERAGKWLIRNDEKILINQEAGAALALLSLSKVLGNERYLRGSEKKLDIVLKNQSSHGFYKEKCGCDIGYSSLTLEMLGKYYIQKPSQDILNSVERLIDFFNKTGKVKNSRGTDWIIVDGFEIFSKFLPGSKKSVKKIFLSGLYNPLHLPDERHICTDLYRYCWSHDNCGFKMDVKPIQFPSPRKGMVKKSGILFLRRRGIHKFRKLKYMWCLK